MSEPPARLLARLQPGWELQSARFADLSGWADADHTRAWRALQRSAQAFMSGGAPLRAGVAPPRELREIFAHTAQRPQPGPGEARQFFERFFTPWRIAARAPTGSRGFLTGYYEPVVPGRLRREPGFEEALLALPAAHVRLQEIGHAQADLDGLTAALREHDGRLLPYPDRAAIEAGALDRFTAPLAWVADGVEAFLIHVQGSARIELPDGRQLRLKYAGRNGRPYTSIGRILIDAGHIPQTEMSLARLKSWLRAAGQAPGSQGRRIMQRNRSFVFFEVADDVPSGDGPIGGANAPLTPFASIAVDRSLWPYGLPFWIDAKAAPHAPGFGGFTGLTIAQDTGSAITGAARADLFFGSGAQCGDRASLVRHDADMYVLTPDARP